MFGILNRKTGTATQVKTKKKFGGKTDGFYDGNERAFEQAHLKAYLGSKKRFIFGVNSLGQKIYHDVKIIWE